ncbi:MAG: tetratricopeptide repeat protein [Tepidisphaeraceae bacterium]
MPDDDAKSQSIQLAAEQLAAGKPQKAVEICRQAIARFPDDAKIHYVLALALNDAQRFSEAIDAYNQAVRLNPEFFEAYNNLGTLLSRRGRFDEAIQALTQAIRLRPELAQTHATLSNALRDNWKLEEAVAAASKALALNPELAQAYTSLGAALLGLGRFDEAIHACQSAIQRKPDSPAAHLNIALAELVSGNLERGWPEYEWRLRCPDALPPRRISLPAWDGTRIDGKTILLYSEQGFGDAIHFIRYVPMVAALGGRVVLECPASLLPLLRGSAGVDRAVATGAALPHCDLQCALPSLPGMFKTTLGSIPAANPYLAADAKTAESWRKRIEPSGDVLQVGLAWAGRAENRNDRNRSIRLEKFSPLANVTGVRFHSLQTNRPANVSFALSDWSDLLKDFAQTAALLANLDLVVSVDTAVAHLAGAMGKPVWLLLPFPPDWRWMLNRSDSPWYPTMRLFRQTAAGDWDAVIRRVAEELANSITHA